MRSKYASVLITAIVLVAISIIFFVIPSEIGKIEMIIFGLTVCTYFCAMLSYYLVFRKKQASVFLHTPIVLIISFLLLIQALFLLLVRLNDSMPGWVYTVGETIIFTLFLVIIISLIASQAYVSRHNEGVANMTSFIKHLELELSVYANSIDDETTKELVNSLLPIVKYSDPVSCSETKQVEEEILRHFQSTKEDDKINLPSSIEKIKQLLTERNKICLAFKK